MKIKWRVGEKPVGRYRSFFKRDWPVGYANSVDHGDVMAMLVPEGDNFEGYLPRLAETTPLKVRVMDRRTHPPEWKRLKGTFVGVKSAKEAAQRFFNENKDWCV